MGALLTPRLDRGVPQAMCHRGLEPRTSSLSGITGHGRYVLRPGSVGLSVCPRVTVTIPDRPPDRARVEHDYVIRRHGRTVQNRAVRFLPSGTPVYQQPVRLTPHDGP